MTIEQQNVAIAEACGWHGIKTGYQATALGPIGMFGPTRGYQHIPNYVTDLNRMHEAEKQLGGDWCAYWSLLETVTGTGVFELNIAEDCYSMLHATAAQRAEAFLRTIGKWIDKTEEF